MLSLRRDVRQMPMTMPPRRLNLCSPHRVFVRQAMSASLILFARKRTNHLVHVELLGFLRPSQSFSDAAKRTTSREVFPPGCVDTWSSPDRYLQISARHQQIQIHTRIGSCTSAEDQASQRFARKARTRHDNLPPKASLRQQSRPQREDAGRAI